MRFDTSLADANRWMVTGVFLASSVLSACSGGSGATTEAERLTNDMAKAICDWAIGCCNNEELLGVLGITVDNDGVDLALRMRDDLNDCYEIAKATLAPTWGRLSAAERAGRLELPSENINACLDYFNTGAGDCSIGSLATNGWDPHPCSAEALAVGLGAAGAPCSSDWECATGLLCKGGGDYGVCGTPQAATEPCSSSAPCGEGLYCSGLTVSFCLDPSSAGNAYCDNDSDCSSDYFCDAASGQCTAKLADGTNCGSNRACLSGVCDTGTGLCLRRLAAGNPCSADAQCGTGGYCDSTATDASTCFAITEVGAGARCDPIRVRCLAGLVCEGGICVDNAISGGWCAGDAYCAAGEICKDYECVARVGVGAACTTNRECVESAFCDNSDECAARAAVGEDCSAADCVLTAYCDYSGSGECESLAGVGDECETINCGPGLYCEVNTGECAAGLAADAYCYRDAMCGENTYCADPAPGTPNVCLPPRTVGEGEACYPWDNEVVCNSGLYCNEWNYECAPRLGEGDYCDPWDTDPGCEDDFFCNDNIYECAPLPGLGEACPDDVCVADLWCDRWGTGNCEATLGQGDDCTTGGTCAAGLYCDYGGLGQCETLPVDGENCRGGQCALGHWCHANTCEVDVTEGGDCPFGDNSCVDGTYCGQVMVCIETYPAGSPCDSGAECDSGLVCVSDGVCRPEIAVGGACNPSPWASDVCAEHATCDPDTATCAELTIGKAAGDACRFNMECASGNCDNGLCLATCVGG